MSPYYIQQLHTWHACDILEAYWLLLLRQQQCPVIMGKGPRPEVLFRSVLLQEIPNALLVMTDIKQMTVSSPSQRLFPLWGPPTQFRMYRWPFPAIKLTQT